MNTVVNRHDQFGWNEERRLVMGKVHDVHFKTAQRQRNRALISPEGLFIRLVKLLEVIRQGTKFMKVTVRTDQEILIAGIDLGEVAYEVPDVRTHAELIDFSNIDRNAHTGN